MHTSAPAALRCLLLLVLVRFCLSQSTSISFIQPANCSGAQYYSSARFSCNSCSSGVRSSDGLSCACPSGFAVSDLGSPQVTCSPCQSVNLDRLMAAFR
ncbi:hypothetical protein GDO81_015704 [Engystomops pustulosus]|uniref:Tyrosine-protein kinase ephrin type A/B receptor-like domain-containing protein n=1 Tax=Engystomops pustulosus TaxID=76066 RepID=A0AAV7AT32_ENGPU|nr:hypothetical protein GDO81_015704 [Engystomops pustulosus]